MGLLSSRFQVRRFGEDVVSAIRFGLLAGVVFVAALAVLRTVFRAFGWF